MGQQQSEAITKKRIEVEIAYQQYVEADEAAKIRSRKYRDLRDQLWGALEKQERPSLESILEALSIPEDPQIFANVQKLADRYEGLCRELAALLISN